MLPVSNYSANEGIGEYIHIYNINKPPLLLIAARLVHCLLPAIVGRKQSKCSFASLAEVIRSLDTSR